VLQSPASSNDDNKTLRPKKRLAIWRMVAFLAIFAGLQALYGAAKGTSVERFVIDQATVKTAAWLIDKANPEVMVQPVGTRLRAPGGGINILNGCEGMDMLCLMIAAMLVAPLPWKAKLAGVVAGTAFIFVLNQARILALFYSFRANTAIFEMLHGLVAPLILITAAGIFFTLWLGKYGPSRALTIKQATLKATGGN
jgi:exosortase/archaeosortase family protein